LDDPFAAVIHSAHGNGAKWRERFRDSQVKFKLEVLKVRAPGSTPPPLSRPSHIYLPEEHAIKGSNFLSPEALSLFRARVASGWGMHPYHCERNLTSSQTLMVNMLSLLTVNGGPGASAMNTLMSRSDVVELEALEIEYAPERPSSLLGDRTRVDALLTVRTKGGSREIVCLEVKLLERLNSRQISLDRNTLMRDAMGALRIWGWADPGEVPLPFNQLFRCQILAAATAKSRGVKATATSLLVVHHPEDSETSRIANDYKGNLADPQLVQVRSLTDFVESIEANTSVGNVRAASSRFRRRYCRS